MITKLNMLVDSLQGYIGVNPDNRSGSFGQTYYSFSDNRLLVFLYRARNLLHAK